MNSKKVEYLLVGGFAVSYYGYPRATADIDVWIAVHPENAVRIVEVLKDFGFNVPDLSQEMFLKPDRVIRMGVPPMRIEILTGISGVDFKECYAERIEDKLDGVPVSLISLPHLKINKKASGRSIDKVDLEKLP